MSKSAFPVSADGIRNVSRPAWLTLGLLACLAVVQPTMATAQTARESAEHATAHQGHGRHAHGAQAEASPVVVSGAYTAAPRPGVPNLAVYIDRVQNRGQQDDQLLSASTGIARATEMHEMKVENDMMRMRQVSAIDIPAGASVDMNKGASSGYHLMVLGVSRPLKAGENFTLTLNFRHAGSQDVQVQVQDVAGHTGGHEHHHDHDEHAGHAHGH